MRRLYDSYAGVLAGICARYITDADDQKDVLQESLIQIYTHISSFTYQGRGSLQAWMARTTINGANVNTGIVSNAAGTTEYNLDNGTIRMGGSSGKRVYIDSDKIEWYGGNAIGGGTGLGTK